MNNRILYLLLVCFIIELLKLTPLHNANFFSTILSNNLFTIILFLTEIISIFIFVGNIFKSFKKINNFLRRGITFIILILYSIFYINIILEYLPENFIVKSFERGVEKGLVGYPAYLESGLNNSSNTLRIDLGFDIYLLLKKDIYQDYCSKKSFDECKKISEDASLILLNKNIVKIIPS